MSGSVNKVILLGNLTRDPEIRSTQAGDRIANLSVATNESWRDKQTGERKERAEFHRVAIFNERLAEVAEKYLTKGSQVYVEGQIQTRKWTDQQGQEKYSTEIVLTKFRGELTMLGSKGGSDQAEPNRAPSRTERAGSRTERARSAGEDLDDDIPFITGDISADPAFRKARAIV